MSGICLDRLLTSTAILLVLMAAAGGALADPATPDTTVTTPAPGNTSAAAPSDTTQQPDQSTTGSTSPAAAVPAPAAPAPAASTPAAPHLPLRKPLSLRPRRLSRHRPMRRSLISCTISPAASSTRSSATSRSARRSMLSIPDAITRRFGSLTARPMTAPLRPSLILAMSTPTDLIPPIIRCRISPPSATLRRWRMPKSNSPLRFSLMRITPPSAACTGRG